MDLSLITTVIRQILLALGATLVTKGYLDAESLSAIVGGVVAVVAVIWGLFSKKKVVDEKKALETQVVNAGEVPVTKQQ